MESIQEKGAVIVTGASSGIGYVLTLRLLKEGYPVSAWDLKLGELEHFTHPLLSFYLLDVGDKQSIKQAVSKTVDEHGAIIGLAACAAVYPAAPFLELDEATWDFTFDVNLKGVLFTCQAVLPMMKKQGYGSIVLFSSIVARTGTVRGSHYAATKGGILGLARSIALDTAKDGIRVNVLSPGITDTPQPRGHSTEEQIYGRAKTIPLKRIGIPEDMVEATLFLLQDDSSYITGQDLRINGGALMF